MSTLQELLNLGLVDIGSDDSRLAKLQDTATSLAKHLRDNPEFVIPATLISIDREVDEDEPLLKVVDTMLVNEWKTIRNTHTDTPRELLRSIVIDALALLGTKEPELASIIWQTAVSPINHKQANIGKEQELVAEMLWGFQSKFEDEAISRAGRAEPPKKARATSKGFQYTQIQGKDIVGDIGGSAGPHDRDGTGYKDPNPHWPSSGHEWSYEFTPRMTQAVARAVNIGMKRVSTAANKELLVHRENLEQRLSIQFETRRARQTELDVLWWSKAKYSPSLRKGYREIESAVAAVLMARDISALVPAMAPASVAHVLGESVAAISHNDPRYEQRTVESLLDSLRSNGANLRGMIAYSETVNGRVPLLEVVSAVVHGHGITREYVIQRTGVTPELELSLPDFSMWVFRDMQARRLVEEIR